MNEISVVIPCRNGASTLAAMLRSLASEAELIREILVVDAASTDGSAALAKTLGAELALPVRIVEAAVGCAGATRNVGIDAAEGAYLYFIDADDQHLPGGLRGLHAALRSHPETGIAVGPFIRSTVGVKTRQKSPRGYVGSPLVNAALYVRGEIPSIGVGSCLVRREAVGALRFPTDLPYDEDTLFWAAVLAHSRVAFSDTPTFVYHVDTRRADDRFVMSPRHGFLTWRSSLRELRRLGLDERSLRMREGIVALKIARVHYARGLYEIAARFLKVAKAAPRDLNARWRIGRYRLKVAASIRRAGMSSSRSSDLASARPTGR